MMIVQCQSCQTRFRVDETRIQGRGARMRCRRCGESIIVMKESASPPGATFPKNLFDLRSVLRQPEREASKAESPRVPPPESVEREPARARETYVTPAWEPPVEEPSVPEAGEEPPSVEPADEAVSLRVPEEPPVEVTAEDEAAASPEEPARARETDVPPAWEPPVMEKFPHGETTPSWEEKPFELLLNDADTLDFLKEESRRPGSGGELDISGILRADPSPDPEPAEVPPPEIPVESLPPEAPMPDRLEAIQRELQEIGGGFPEPEKPAPASPPEVSSVPPVRKAPSRTSKVVARPAELRSGRPSLVPLAILFFLIAGGGAYLGFTSGGQQLLRQAVPALESLWLGEEAAGTLFSVKSLIGYYEPNATAGPLFVIKGTVTNRGRKKRSGIRVHAELLDSNGTHVAEKTVFAGNILSVDTLRSSPKEAIEKKMSNRWGDKLSNLDVATDKSIPFMVVFFDAPPGIAEYRLDPRDSE